MAELPDELIVERAAAWQRTVRGHLRAAVEVIPDETLSDDAVSVAEECVDRTR